MSDDHHDHDDRADSGDDGPPDADEPMWVGDLLRREPVQVDPVRRERAIATALAAAHPATGPGPGSGTEADGRPGTTATGMARSRRHGARWRLAAAAAIVAIAGLGAVTLSIGVGDGEDSASAPESADSGGAGAQQDSPTRSDGDETGLPTSPGGPATSTAAPPGDLGVHPDTRGLLDTVVGPDASVRVPGVASRTDGGTDDRTATDEGAGIDGAVAPPCVAGDGVEFVGTARVGTDPASAMLVVVVADAGAGEIVVFDAVSCEAIDRRAL